MPQAARKLAAAERANAKLQAALDEAEAENKKLKSDLEASQAALNAANARIAGLEQVSVGRAAAHVVHAAVLPAAVSSRDAACLQDMAQMRADFEASLATLRSQMDEMAAQMAALEADLASAKAMIANLEGQIAQLQEQIAAGNSRANEAANAFNELEAELKHLYLDQGYSTLLIKAVTLTDIIVNALTFTSLANDGAKMMQKAKEIAIGGLTKNGT